MYHPDINSYDDTGIKFEFKKVEISSTENIVLNSWYSFKNSNYKTLVFFHGNAGNLNNRIYKLNKINQLNLNFIINKFCCIKKGFYICTPLKILSDSGYQK